MGYCYDAQRRLVCDNCSHSGSARKHKCPSGYCPSLALCRDCKAKLVASGKWKEIHAGCKARADEWRAVEDKRRALLDSGAYVRCSALGKSGIYFSVVRVLFENKERETIGFDMARETYHAYPLLEPTTPDDYRKHGEIFPALPSFDDVYALSHSA